MPGFLLHVGATVMCPHAAPATAVSSNTRVFVSGQPVATMADLFTVTGCAFAPGGPSPCLTVRWLVPATRVLVNGQPALLQDSTGLCLNPAQAPQGPPVVAITQVRVRGM